MASGNGVEVASAYVVLTTKFPDVKKDTEEALGEAEPVAEKSGQEAGKKWGTALAAGVAAAAAVVTAAVVGLYNVGGVFDDVNDTIRVGTGATGKQLEGLVAVAENVGRTVPAEFSKIGPTVADLNTRLGLSGSTLEKVASQYLEAGRLLGEDLNIQTSTAAFNAFRISGEDVSTALDTVFQISQSTGIGMNQLLSTVQTAAPLVQQLGFSFNDTAFLVGALDKAGLDANATLGKLAPALVRMAKDGEAPAEVFPRVVSELQGFIAAGEDAAALNLAEEVFGSRGASQFIGALQSGVINLNDMSAAVAVTGDTILGLSKETADAAESWQIFKNNALLAIEPVASAVFSLAGEGMNKIVEWAQANGPAISGMFSQLGETFGPIITQVIELWTQFSPLSLLFQALQPVLPTLSNVFALLGQQLGQVGELFGALVAAVMPLIQQLLSQLLPALLPIVETFLQIGAAVFPIITALLPPLIELLGVILTPIITVLTIVLQALKPVFDIIGAVIAYVSGLIQVLGVVFGGVVETISALMRGDLSAIPGIWEGIWNSVVDIAKGTWNNVVGFIESGVNAVIGLINGLIGGINSATGGLGISIPLIGHVSIPRLAEGGIVTGDTLALVGEGRHPELVQPLGGPKLDLLTDAVAEKVNATAPQSVEARFSRADLKYMAREFARFSAGLQQQGEVA